MNASYDKNTAVVVLPAIRGGRLKDTSLRAWLARSGLSLADESAEQLARVTAELGLPYPAEGLAALRFWGQTGERPTVWMAGADPVFLEPSLDRLWLHALGLQGVAGAELGPLMDHLQHTLAADAEFGFVHLGSQGYLRADQPVATAAVSAEIAHLRDPGEFMPAGADAAAHHRLSSEIQMALHEHEVNQQRVMNGAQPINALWLWGGGMAPEAQARAQPPLFADDPLLTGYWESALARSAAWPGSLKACAAAANGGFVAAPPVQDHRRESLQQWLGEARQLLQARAVDRLVLLSRDGIRAEVSRTAALKFWRRDSRLLT